VVLPAQDALVIRKDTKTYQNSGVSHGNKGERSTNSIVEEATAFVIPGYGGLVIAQTPPRNKNASNAAIGAIDDDNDHAVSASSSKEVQRLMQIFAAQWRHALLGLPTMISTMVGHSSNPSQPFSIRLVPSRAGVAEWELDILVRHWLVSYVKIYIHIHVYIYIYIPIQDTYS
jgi:hypothetical protein